MRYAGANAPYRIGRSLKPFIATELDSRLIAQSTASIFIDSLAKVSLLKVGISPVGIPKDGLSQDTSAEVSARQDGTVEHSASTIFLPKDRSS